MGVGVAKELVSKELVWNYGVKLALNVRTYCMLYVLALKNSA